MTIKEIIKTITQEKDCPVCLGKRSVIVDGKTKICLDCNGIGTVPTEYGEDLLLFLKKHLHGNELSSKITEKESPREYDIGDYI